MGIISVILIVLFYFLPALIAIVKQKRNQTAIFVLNLFLGWTFIGWVGALVWSVCVDKDERNEKIRREILSREK